MRNAGFLEFVTGDDEAVASVKRNRVLLRVEDNAAMPLFAGTFDKRRQQCSTDAAAAPRRQHRHAPDVAIGQKTPASNRIPIAVTRERVRAKRIDIVPLQCFRSALLDDENGPADCTERVAIARPIGQSQRKLGRPVYA